MICIVDEHKAGNAAGDLDGREQLAFLLKVHGRQTELARQLGCSAAHLSNIAKKKRGMSYRFAKRLSEATGISVDALMGGDA